MNSQLIATPTASDESTSGLIVFWTVAGGTCDHEQLCEELQAVKAVPDNELPALPTNAVAFHRALRQFEGPSRFLRSRRGHASSFYLVDEAQDGETIEHKTELLFELEDGKIKATGADPEDLAAEARVEYAQQGEVLNGRDVGLWLIEQTKTLDGIPLRPSGGMYFIPRTNMDRWRKISAAVHEASPYQVFEIPAMHTDEAVEAILAAVLAESKAEAARISDAIKGGTLGGKALRTRAARAEALAAKVERYEGLLDQQIENYREEFEELSGLAVRAALKAEAEATKEAGAKGSKNA